ncbi:MAG: hypothetical protein ACK5NT_12480 [Pyrinomonadaceae bacterium]
MKGKSVILTGILFVLAGSAALGFVNDVLTQLNLQTGNANRFILNNFVADFSTGGVNAESSSNTNDTDSVRFQSKTFQIPKVSTLQNLIGGNRAATATEFAKYVREYVESAEFATDYATRRANAMPKSEPSRPDEASIKDMKNSLRQMESVRKSLPASARSQMDKSINDLKKQIAIYDDPTPNKSLWMKKYPQDPSVVVKKALEEYLETAATVDFDAKLKTVGQKQKFVNPTYEAKSLKWKAIYRAGRESNQAVIAFVKKWLNEGVKTSKL